MLHYRFISRRAKLKSFITQDRHIQSESEDQFSKPNEKRKKITVFFQKKNFGKQMPRSSISKSGYFVPFLVL